MNKNFESEKCTEMSSGNFERDMHFGLKEKEDGFCNAPAAN
jgi:hypothetical protein